MKKMIATCMLIQFLFWGCKTKPKMIAVLDSPGFSKTKFRNIGYIVKHPSTMRLSADEWYQKWQDSSFLISNPDSLAPYCNSFGIRLGLLDSTKVMGWDLPVIDIVQSQVMGSIIDWNIHKNNNEYFVAEARLLEIRFICTSVTRAGLDSMIGCVSTFSSE